MATKTVKKGSIRTVDIDDLPTSFRETGCIPMDLALTNGKGLPEGGAILFYATSGCGKTTIYADMIKHLLENALAKDEAYKVVYVDVEGSRELLLSMGLGNYIASGDLILKEGAITFAQLEELYAKVLAWYEDPDNPKNDETYKDVKCIVVDSLNMVQSQALMDKAVDDGDFGSNAKERSRFYPKYFTRCKACGVTNLYITQVRVNINGTAFSEATKAAISPSDKFFFDIVIKGSKSERAQKDAEKVTVNTAFGALEMQDRCMVTISSGKGEWVKNRYGHFPDIPLILQYGKRVISAYTLREMLVNWGYIKEKAGYFTVGPQLNEAMGWDFGDKSVRKKAVNSAISQDVDKVVLFLKSEDMFKIRNLDEDIYDDGF